MLFRSTFVLLIATVAFGAAGPPAAHAATLTTSSFTEVVGSHGEVATFFRVTLAAAPGERNDVTARVEPAAPGHTDLVVTDAGGSPLTAGEGCARQTDGSVRCDFTEIASFVADLGDGNDRITLAPPVGVAIWHGTPSLNGGDGDDILDAGGAAALFVDFDGGVGADVEVGGIGTDTFAGDPGHDTISGGPGHDILDYGRRTDAIRATLGTPRPGDEDTISGVEVLVGGTGDDDFTGSDGEDWIDGRRGADVIDGRGGDDHLLADSGGTGLSGDIIHGGSGNDLMVLGRAGRADGGAGADRITGGAKTAVAGGPGRDELTGGVVTADDDGASGDFVRCVAGDRVRAVLGAGDVSARCGSRARRAAGRPGLIAVDRQALIGSTVDNGKPLIYMTIWCADEAPRAGCPTRISVLDAGGRTVAQRAQTLRRGVVTQRGITYNKGFSQRLAAAGALRVTIVATARGAHGRVVTDRLTRCLQASDAGTDVVPCRSAAR